jgi:signal transduction histidine kinase
MGDFRATQTRYSKSKNYLKINDMPTVDCDKNLMKIAFENIISNAIKYTSKVTEAYIETGIKSVTKDMVIIF